MQLTAQLAIEAARDRRESGALAPSTDVNSKRDFLMCVTMELKETLDRRDFLNPVTPPRSGAISANDVRANFLRLAKTLRPEFEVKTQFRLVLSGEIMSNGPPYRFINLWDIETPSDVPRMMEILALPADKSQTYGHLDYLVQEETQNISRVFPAGQAQVSSPSPGKRLYYVLLGHQPPTVELYRFRVFFAAYSQPMPVAGASFKLITSSISITGVLNRIEQFWSVEVDAGVMPDEVRQLVKNAFGSLPWRNPVGGVFNAEDAIILRPTEWDVSVNTNPSSPKKGGVASTPQQVAPESAPG